MANTTKKMIEGDFSHTVLFWLKNPSDKSDRSLLEAGMAKLIANSLYVVSHHVAVPAGTDRPVVDNSYSYSYIVTFDSAADQDQYQTEQAHKIFIDECSHLWDKVVIYDAVRVAK